MSMYDVTAKIFFMKLLLCRHSFHNYAKRKKTNLYFDWKSEYSLPETISASFGPTVCMFPIAKDYPKIALFISKNNHLIFLIFQAQIQHKHQFQNLSHNFGKSNRIFTFLGYLFSIYFKETAEIHFHRHNTMPLLLNTPFSWLLFALQIKSFSAFHTNQTGNKTFGNRKHFRFRYSKHWNTTKKPHKIHFPYDQQNSLQCRIFLSVVDQTARQWRRQDSIEFEPETI